MSQSNSTLHDSVLQVRERLQAHGDSLASTKLTSIADTLKIVINTTDAQITSLRQKRAADEICLENVEKRRKCMPHTVSPYQGNEDDVQAKYEDDEKTLIYCFAGAFNRAIHALKTGDFVWHVAKYGTLQKVQIVGLTFVPGLLPTKESKLVVQVGKDTKSYCLEDMVVGDTQLDWDSVPIWPLAVEPWSESVTQSIYTTIFNVANENPLVFCEDSGYVVCSVNK